MSQPPATAASIADRIVPMPSRPAFGRWLIGLSVGFGLGVLASGPIWSMLGLH